MWRCNERSTVDYTVFESEVEAREFASGDETVIPLCGDPDEPLYKVVSWSEYNYSVSEEARALFDGGWTSQDADEMAAFYAFPIWYAEDICLSIEEIEDEKEEEAKSESEDD